MSNDLLDIQKSGKDLRELFSIELLLDWYDDITSGIVRLKSTGEQFFVNLCYFEPDKPERILFLINVNQDWTAALKKLIKKDQHEVTINDAEVKKRIGDYFNSYGGSVFLIKTESFVSSISYKIIQTNRANLRYYPSVEDALSNRDDDAKSWSSLFSD